MKFESIKENYTKFLSLLFLMMLVFPYMYMGIKVFFISIILIAFLFSRFKSNLEIRYQLWIIVFFIMNLIYYVYGVFVDNPGVHYYLLVFLMWPILYYIFCSLIDEKSIKVLLDVLKISYYIIIVVGLLAFMQLNGFVPEIFNLDLWDISSGDRPLFFFQAIKSGSTVSFIFLFPFFYSMLLIDKEFSRPLFNRIIFFMALVYIVATTRRAILFSIFYLPILIFLFSRLSKVEESEYSRYISLKRIAIISSIPILILFIVGITTNLIDFNLITDLFSASFNSDDDTLGSDRDEQFFALIEGWLNNPIFGAGPGIDASVSRSELPGSYELTYVALLFSRGFFGFIIYIVQFLLLIIWGVRLSKVNTKYRNIIISFNVAFMSFLISNGSNPYLEAYDHMWVLYLYIAMQSIIYKSIKDTNHEESVCVNSCV